MKTKLDEIKELIDDLSGSELESLRSYLRLKIGSHPLEQEWGITSDLILDAISRSQDITKRGVRGVIAEAVFETQVLPTLRGWRSVKVEGDLSYDFKIQEEDTERILTIQVKLQRTEKGAPLKGRGTLPADCFVVEIQKTRSGKKKAQSKTPGVHKEAGSEEKTRPYKFGDFDILAVNMQPSSRDWSRFMYTVGTWLVPRTEEQGLIQVMQPVNSICSDVWTDSLEECVTWYKSGLKKVLLTLPRKEPKHAKKKSAQQSRKKRKRH